MKKTVIIGVVAVLVAIATIVAVLLIKQEETPPGETKAISITPSGRYHLHKSETRWWM